MKLHEVFKYKNVMPE